MLKYPKQETVNCNWKGQKQASFRSFSVVFPVTSALYTVTVSYRPLFKNQVPADCYLYTRRLKQKIKIRISLLYSRCNDRKINTIIIF